MVVAYIDGGARGNPGPAGFGVRIEQPDGTLVEEFHEAIGTATNNVAEYRGLLAALEWAKRRGERDLLVRSDSLLLVQQMKGIYKVKNEALQALHAKARVLVFEIGKVAFEHVERAKNKHADRLANEAMDGTEVAGRKSKVASPESQVASPAGDPFSPLERAVRLFIYDHFVKTTKAPTTEEIAAGVKSKDDAVDKALRRLAELRAIVLAPASTAIWMAHPFSAVATAYPVDIAGKRYWANCAWDAIGVLSLVGDGVSKTQCADCGTELAMTVRDSHVQGDGVIHYAVPPRRFWENVAFT